MLSYNQREGGRFYDKSALYLSRQDCTIENHTSLCRPMPQFARVPHDLYYHLTTIDGIDLPYFAVFMTELTFHLRNFEAVKYGKTGQNRGIRHSRVFRVHIAKPEDRSCSGSTFGLFAFHALHAHFSYQGENYSFPFSPCDFDDLQV